MENSKVVENYNDMGSLDFFKYSSMVTAIALLIGTAVLLITGDSSAFIENRLAVILATVTALLSTNLSPLNVRGYSLIVLFFIVLMFYIIAIFS